MTKISLSAARHLLDLANGETVNHGSFTGKSKTIVSQLIKDGVLDYIPVGKQQRKLFCPKPHNLHQYLHHKFEITSLESYITYLQSKQISRGDAVLATADSKFKKTTIFSGFLVNAYHYLPCALHDQPFLIAPKDGTYTFIHQYQNFRVPNDVTIVGIENYENFRDIDRQHQLFPNIRPLFVWRYLNSNAIADWVKSIPNPYLHFGDYDPKGLQIYCAEFRQKIGPEKCGLLIPDNLDELVFQYSEKDLYLRQQNLIDHLISQNIDEVNQVLHILQKHKKGLAQEALIQA